MTASAAGNRLSHRGCNERGRETGPFFVSSRYPDECLSVASSLPMESPMRLALAAALLVATSAPALAAPLHSYSGLALSAAGDRVASVEEDESPAAKPA